MQPFKDMHSDQLRFINEKRLLVWYLHTLMSTTSVKSQVKIERKSKFDHFLRVKIKKLEKLTDATVK